MNSYLPPIQAVELPRLKIEIEDQPPQLFLEFFKDEQEKAMRDSPVYSGKNPDEDELGSQTSESSLFAFDLCDLTKNKPEKCEEVGLLEEAKSEYPKIKEDQVSQSVQVKPSLGFFKEIEVLDIEQ